MRRMIHALAAMGAALVFGCGAPDVPDDGPMPTQVDIGEAQQAVSSCQNMGYPVTSSVSSTGPRITVAPSNGKEGLPCYDRSLPNQGYDCALPIWARHPNDAIYWNTVMDSSTNFIKNCNTSVFGKQVFTNEADIGAAFAAWKAATGINFVRNPNNSDADYHIFCEVPARQSTNGLDDSGQYASTGNTAEYTVNGRAFNRWSSGPFGAVTPPGGSTEPNNLVWYHHAITFLDDIKTNNVLRDKCHIPSGTRFNNAQRSVTRYIMTHEIGHALGFADLADGHGVMSGTADLCSIVGDGSTVAAVPSIPSQYHAAITELVSHANDNTVFYPDTSNCATLDFGRQHLGAGTGNTPTNHEVAAIAAARAAGDLNDLGAIENSSASPAAAPPIPPFPPSPNLDNTQTSYYFAFTDNNTYGVQTGVAHKSCDFTSTGQVCALPSGHTIHWCFGDNLGETDHENLSTRTDDPTFALLMGWSAPAPLGYSMYALGGFTFVRHASCLDPEVELVVDVKACPGINSTSMDGYVCMDLPPLTSANQLALHNHSPWNMPGQYYNWGTNAGYTVLHIDTGDIATSGDTNLHRWQVMAHAILLGLDWVTGIGSRTDRTDLYSSLAVLPLAKTNNLSGGKGIYTGGEYCRSTSFTTGNGDNGGNGQLDTYPPGFDYCGPD